MIRHLLVLCMINKRSNHFVDGMLASMSVTYSSVL